MIPAFARRLCVGLLLALALPCAAQKDALAALELAFARGASDSVITELGHILQQPATSKSIRFEASMLMAECWYQRVSMELFSAWNDSAATMLTNTIADEECWARVEVNRSRYAHVSFQPASSLKWGLSALERYRSAGDPSTWKYAFQIHQALGTTYRNILLPNRHTFDHYNTAQALLSQRRDVIPYWQAMLNKAVSNAAMDLMRPEYPDRARFADICNREQLAALRILEKHYPQQLLDRCNMQNLRGLYHIYTEQPDSALCWLTRTEQLISSQDEAMREDALASAWFASLRWQAFIMAQAPWSTDVPVLQAYLTKLNASQDRFTSYARDRSIEGGLFFPDRYWSSPFTSIMFSCARLWKLTGDTTYIDQALWAAEKVRRVTWNTAQRGRGHRDRTLSDPPPNMIQAVQKGLGPDEAVMICAQNSLVKSLEEVIILVVTPHEVAMHFSNTSLHANHGGLIGSSDLANYRRLYHSAYKEIYEPVEPILRNTPRVRVFPSGNMATVAFDALLADTSAQDIRACGPLVQRHAFSYPLLLLPPNAPASPSGGKALYIAPSPGEGPLTDLKRMRGALRQWASGSTIDSAFQKSSLSTGFEQAQEIYLAGHVGGWRQLDMQPWHYFSTDTSSTSSWFQPSDLLKLDLQADLVVHLACQSGLFDVDNNGGGISFARAFLLAGARNVVGSQYLANEATTIQLIALFRDELAKGVPKDIALQRAKLAYLEQCRTAEEAHPINWAGWQLHGKVEASAEQRTTAWPWLIGGSLLALFFGWVAMCKRSVE